MTAASGLLQGVSQYEAGQTRGRLLRSNAQIAGMQAQSEEQAGAVNANMIRMRTAATVGTQVAATGANNLQQSGTPAMVQAQTRGLGELDALTTTNNALRRAWGFQVQGASDTFQAEQADRGSVYSGIGSVLGGSAKAYSQYNRTADPTLGQSGSWF